ncbi:hypothetical protein CCP3SC1AL1_700005 [Gammaproteobacteria bacterium]
MLIYLRGIKVIRITIFLALIVGNSTFAETLLHLQDGSPIIVDEVNHAVFLPGKEKRPLWDGVHRLDNGQAVTVSGGILIQQFSVDQRVSSSITACKALVREVCGTEGHCDDTPACHSAKQLLEMEQAQPSSSACSEARSEATYFTSCTE